MTSWRILKPEQSDFGMTGLSVESSPLSLHQVTGCAALLVPLLSSGMEIGLEGELGAGKTTFMRLLGAALKSREPISSPTFTLCHEYHLASPQADGLSRIEHWDLYRVSHGIEELRESPEPNTIRFIEWHERMPELAARLSLRIRFDFAPAAEGELEARIVRLWGNDVLAPKVQTQFAPLQSPQDKGI